MVTQGLAPGLLLAAAQLGDANFGRSVILLAQHNDNGALGWVVNGTEVVPVAQLLRDAGLTPEDADLPETDSYEQKARIGGPVSPRSAWILYERTPNVSHPGEMVLSDSWAASGAKEFVDLIARGEGPRMFRLLLGYAGWAAGQLDQEILSGAWLPARFDEGIVFGAELDMMWERAYAELIGVSPFAFMGMRTGSA